MFETTLEKLARILARQYGIEVIFEGNQAYTDGKKIVLPFFKEISDELKADLNGFLDHEVAHCKFTDMNPSVVKKYPSLKKRIVKELANATEDIRIERLMKAEFPGCAFNIDPLRVKMHKRHFDQWDKIPAVARIILNVQYGMEGREQKIDTDIERYMKAIKPETDKLNSCTNYHQIVEVCERIAKILEDERAVEKEEDKEESDDEEKKAEKKKGDKGEKKKGKKSESKDKGGEGDDGDASDSGEGDDSEGEDGSESDSDSGDGEGSGMTKESGEEMDKMLTESSDGDPSGESGFNKANFDIEGHINEELKDKLEAEPTRKIESGYRYDPVKSGMTTSVPVTTRFDRVTDLTGKGDSYRYQTLRKKVRPLVAPIKAQLERVLKVKENARWRTEREQGKVNARALSALAVNGGYRQIFKEFTKTETNNVAVEILVDLSGSMCYRIETAKMAAIAMSEALKELDIKFEVTGFTSVGDPGVRAKTAELSGAERGRFNRFGERLELFVFKDWNSANLSGIERMTAMDNNPDGECVKWAANRLALRKEKRKILLVLSDGQPAADGDTRILQADLKQKVEEIQKSGIECVGIGIETDAVKDYYKDFVVINNIGNLPKETMTKLSKIIGD